MVEKKSVYSKPNYFIYVIAGVALVGFAFFAGYITLQMAAGGLAIVLIAYFLFFIKNKLPIGVITYKPIDHEKEISIFQEKLLRMGIRCQIDDTSGEPKHGVKGAEPYLQYYRALEYNPRTLAYDLPLLIKIAVATRAIIDIEHNHIHFENAFSDWSGAPKGVGRHHPETIYRPLPIQIKTGKNSSSEHLKELRNEEESVETESEEGE